MLDVDETRQAIRQPARLYRVGTANAADAGLDMWANFGPAVQVKHISLTASDCEGICDGLRAEQIVIVCKSADARTIKAVLANVGLANRIRGIITEVQLARWYAVACGEKYCATLGQDLLAAILTEISLEFPQVQTVGAFMKKRGYDISRLSGMWAVRSEGDEDSEE